MTTLLMSSRYTDDDQALWRVAVQRGWTVQRVRGIRIPELAADDEIIIYVEPLYGPTIAAALGVRLLEPPEDWLSHLPAEFVQRTVEVMTLGTARRLSRPAFIKPPNDKSFEARVYEFGAALPPDLPDESTVLVSEPVRWQLEFRCFCLDGTVRTASPYLRDGVLARDSGYAADAAELARATQFAECVLAATGPQTPRAVVIDVGELSTGALAVVEANGAWGSGIYGCDPEAALDVIRAATIHG